MRASCREGSAKIGRISSKRMPGEGKSGYWRRAPRSFTLRLASSAALEEWEEGCPATWAEASGAVDWDMMREKRERARRRGNKNREGLKKDKIKIKNLGGKISYGRDEG